MWCNECLWWHVGLCYRARGWWGHTRVHVYQPRHPKISHLCSDAFANKQDIVAGEIFVDDIVGVKIVQGECHIMTDTELGVVREGTGGPLYRNRVKLSSISSIRRACLCD